MERPSEDDEPKLEKRVPPIDDQVSPISPSASVDHEPAPPLAGHEKKKKEEIVCAKIIFPTSPSASVDHEPAPPLAGHEKKKKEERVWEIIPEWPLGEIQASGSWPVGRLVGEGPHYDSDPLANQGIYSSVKSQLPSGSKGTKSQSSSASGQVPLPTEGKKR